ncbi:Phosphoglycerate dehydrogenase [Alteribacillus iranensis]|uniref:Phosphoglycerate dehydrogenase n=1 Tax=Alteribacillus iranensis TaxID=930128 RepID=A0A1I2BSP8_9BACI|nr:Phosphoglycerate dehydrogenase [Alteribacillus iranensis]
MILCTTEDVESYRSEIKKETADAEVFLGKINSLTEEEKEKIEIIISYGNYDDRLLEKDVKSLPNLRWIQIISSGVDQLPLEYLKRSNILVTTVKGIHRIPISEYVMAMILYFSKKIPEFYERKQQKHWDASIMLHELHGKTIGIWGTGHIGREVAAKSKAFGMKTVGVNRSGNQVEHFDDIYTIEQLQEVVGTFDYICSVLPSNPGTRGIVTSHLIEKMKDDVVFVNVGRGDLIVEEDFIEALKRKKISGAALDVFHREPLEENHPFWELDNVVITPHASAHSEMYARRALQIFYQNFKLFKQQSYTEMINRV